MCGGRVGKDGIHGVTASSEIFSEHTPAGHVQIGDPYTQKKMHDFLLEARDAGADPALSPTTAAAVFPLRWANRRGFQTARDVDLEKVPLKYDGLDQWEIWVSESQERMTVAIRPEACWTAFMALSRRHAVESTVIGRYTDSGKLHITYNGKTCAYMDMDLLTVGFSPVGVRCRLGIARGLRGLYEPVLQGADATMNRLLAGHAGAPQYLLHGVDQPPVRP